MLKTNVTLSNIDFEVEYAVMVQEPLFGADNDQDYRGYSELTDMEVYLTEEYSDMSEKEVAQELGVTSWDAVIEKVYEELISQEGIDR